MNPEQIIQILTQRLDGVIAKPSWGETSLFYNPQRQLPNGVYFCTIKDHDGENDKASQLDREDVFRLAIGLAPSTYSMLFGDKPKRPAKGCVVATDDDFTALDRLMPHPIYAWMGWVQILNPSQTSFDAFYPYLVEAHQIATIKFNRKISSFLDLK